MALTVATTNGGVTSTVVAGAVTAPTASLLICRSGVMDGPANGTWAYKVVLNTYQTGTPDANGANMYLNIGGTSASGTISGGTTIGVLLTTNQFSPQTFRIGVAAGQEVFVVCGNSAGGAGSIYNASMSLTRLSSLYGDI